jgi:hypothetical protein
MLGVLLRLVWLRTGTPIGVAPVTVIGGLFTWLGLLFTLGRVPLGFLLFFHRISVCTSFGCPSSCRQSLPGLRLSLVVHPLSCFLVCSIKRVAPCAPPPFCTFWSVLSRLWQSSKIAWRLSSGRPVQVCRIGSPDTDWLRIVYLEVYHRPFQVVKQAHRGTSFLRVSTPPKCCG